MAVKKLNSMRFLEQQKIPYEVFEYDDSRHSANEVAELIGVSAHEVFKTLVVMPEDAGSKKPLLVLLSAPQSLDLKKLARATGYKKVRMAAHDEAEKLTGLKVGGISSLALTHKNWSVYIDQQATQFTHIYMSAGQRGINLRVPVADFITALKVTAIDCAEGSGN
ncbi:MAG: aminoacyl-tRNA deacylase [Chloroflexi bacterium]|nr:aminoacyl-tRNA deacylase [Chloroflexota bacterium]